ncbi:TetR/AcrR family transcriptional regulator [Pelomonas sp. SE-A7]|uniref:TetR/AcrR family transcriptional regulator n=1 Tax=Pelomonas sp. SE-A7 TaxID=3054953 RepID=UPI00259C7F73|nr:TetR/AcrR family transcriptional regulator [Pelomonas sp. SE-A7]MDM4765414.1 TetR/AcrR family transcriptional regulator [Pelomonas sp. SE-A7]
MSTTPSRKELSHQRILEAAAAALRRAGPAGVGVAEVMREAGLTHGGFYAHFASREALIAEALIYAGHSSSERLGARAEAKVGKGQSGFRALVESYLGDGHLAAVEQGCPVAALASELPRQSGVVHEAGLSRIHGLIDRVRRSLPEGDADAAGVVTAQMVGSLQLARALGDNAEGRALLKRSRQELLSRYEPQEAQHIR